MKTNSITENFCSSKFLKIINVLFLGLILISNSSFASTSVNEREDSNKVVKHSNPSDDKDALKISLPNERSVKKADKEIHLNMARLIKEYSNPTLLKPDMQVADQEIRDAFFSNYRINFNGNATLSDEELTNLFIAYNLMLPSSDLYALADDDMNFGFFVYNYMTINAQLFLTGDSTINQNFNAEQAE